MSIQAVSWALSQDLAGSSTKFVLVCLANYADQRGICYPSQAQLCDDTGQDRKTVQLNIARLIRAGLLRDTGQRIGFTKSIVVFKILGLPESSRTHIVYRTFEPSTGEYYIGKRSFDGDPKLDDYRGSGRWVLQKLSEGATLIREILSQHMTSGEALAAETVAMRAAENDPLCKNVDTPKIRREKARAEHARWHGEKEGKSEDRENWDSLEALPLFPSSEPVFPAKLARFSREASPKTGYGTIKEPSRNHQEPKTPCPLSADVFEAALKAYPKRIGNDPRQAAVKAWNARLREGVTPESILDGVVRYARFCEATGKVNTEKVMMRATFFGPEHRFEQAFDIPAGAVDAPGAKQKVEAPTCGVVRDGQRCGKPMQLSLAKGFACCIDCYRPPGPDRQYPEPILSSLRAHAASHQFAVTA